MRSGTEPGGPPARVGIVGAGMLGSAVGARLLDSGVGLAVYNRTAEKAEALGSRGALVAGSPREVAEASDIVLTVVRDAGAVSEVSFGRGGIVEGLHDGLAVADMSTVNPFESRGISARFARHGIRKLDAPVMGGPKAAAAGDLAVMCSGDREEFERFEPLFRTIGRDVFYLGGDGVAHSVKLAMNLQIAMLALSLSEGIVLAERSGVDPEAFLEVLNSTYFSTGMSRNKAHGMVRRSHDPTFTLENLKKDVSTMTETARELGIRLPMTERAEGVYGDAADGGLGGVDYTGIIEHVRRLNGY